MLYEVITDHIGHRACFGEQPGNAAGTGRDDRQAGATRSIENREPLFGTKSCWNVHGFTVLHSGTRVLRSVFTFSCRLLGMNEYLAAAISGVVEGITEFLPISSTGHLIVTSELLRFDTQGAFEIIIQLGAVLSVVWFYRQQLLRQAREVRTNTGTRRFWLGVLLAFLPAALVGFLLGDLISQYLFKPTVVASSLIVGGVVMWLVESRPQRSEAVSVEQVRPMQALTIGVIQLLALVPGVSRSASTIIGGMLTGLSRPAATEFSFYLSMPTLGAASLYSLLKHRDEVATQGWGVVAIGLVVSFIVALLAIGWLLRYISRHDFKGFAVYRVFAGIAILLFFHFRGN